MKYFIFKSFSTIILLSLIFFAVPAGAQAAAPDIIGRVITSTGAPVSGVWVRWKANPGYYRHIKTDTNGNFIFKSWVGYTASERQRQITTQIDSDLNGSLDVYQAYFGPGDHSSNNYQENDFSCGDVPHTFTVIKPVNMDGTFDEISGIKINNGNNTVVLDDIKFNSNNPPPTATPTPIGLKTKVANFGIVPVSGIHGKVFIDINENGQLDPDVPGEVGFTGKVTIAVTGASYAQKETDAAGNFSFPTLPNGTYQVWADIPFNYSSTSPKNVTRTIPPGAEVNFGVISSYTVTGNVYNDINKNLKMDPGETTIANAVINSPGGTVNMWNGRFEIQDLKSGSYTITYSSPLPKGYYYLYPKPPSFDITVGQSCSVDATTGAACTATGISNLNFAVSDSWPWLQTYGLDIRFDDGFTDLLPAATACGGGSYASGTDGSIINPGIIFTGDGSIDTGQGSVSKKNWVVGGITYPEVYNSTDPLTTATQNLQNYAKKAGIDIVPLSSFGKCQNPSSECDLRTLSEGVYYTPGDINLNTSANFSNGTYIIIAGGNIRITNGASIKVVPGSTLILAAARDLIIDRSVSAASDTCPVPAGQLEGVFSADRNLIIDGNNGNCISGADKMLNIEGSLIANAERNGGKLDNRRDLCANDRSYPSLTIKARADFILNAPGFLTEQQTISHEEAP